MVLGVAGSNPVGHPLAAGRRPSVPRSRNRPLHADERRQGGIMGEQFDPLRIVAGLRAHGVNYVLIGGLAAAAHGSPVETDDMDICLASDDQNLDRFGLALLDLGANPVPDDGEDEDRSLVRHRCRSTGLHGARWTVLGARVEREGHRSGSRGRRPRCRSEGPGGAEAIGRRPLRGGASRIARRRSRRAEVGEREEHLSGPVREGNGWGTKLMKSLERVDTWLTDLNNGDIHRRQKAS